MEQALIEMAKQIAKLQEENEKLKKQSSKNKLKSKSKDSNKNKIDPEAERFERVSNWVKNQYQKGFDAALNSNENKKRLTQIRKIHPAFIPVNNCMESWPKDVTQIK